MSTINSTITEKLLEHYPVFRKLPDHLLQTMVNEGQRLKAPAGHVLFNVDSPCEAFPMLFSGEVRVERVADSGRKILLYTVQPGESCILTVSSLLGNSTYPAMGTTGSEVSAFAISRSFFMRLVEESADFRIFVFQYFSQRIAHLMELIENLAWDKMQHRVAALLVKRSDKVESTHQALADELGTVREVVSRILKTLETEGLVKLSRGKIDIIDRERLKIISTG